MLSVAVHKDIAEYQPKIVGKMTMRTLISITGALSVSVLAGLYIYFVLGLNVSDCTYFIYAVSFRSCTQHGQPSCKRGTGREAPGNAPIRFLPFSLRPSCAAPFQTPSNGGLVSNDFWISVSMFG